MSTERQKRDRNRLLEAKENDEERKGGGSHVCTLYVP